MNIRKASFGFCFILVITMVCSVACLGQSQQPAEAASLKAFLQSNLRRLPLPDDETTRYFDAWVDLNGDGKQEVIVYIISRRSCGSGGCPTLVLANEGSSYRVVTRITITRPPIRVLPTVSHGWRNLTVQVRGGGIQEPYEAELRFDGVSYPTNPSSVQPVARGVSGEILLPESANYITNGKPLYQ